jgi:hypothetical protein
MMLRLSHNRVIVLDRRRTNLTLLSTDFANTADDKGNDFEIRHNGSLSTDHATGLPGTPTAFVSNGLASHTTLVSGDRSV